MRGLPSSSRQTTVLNYFRPCIWTFHDMGTRIDDVLLSPARLDELLRLRLLDTPPEEPFDRLTRLAARLLEAPVALLSLIDDHRQFFKSACGLSPHWMSIRETPLSHSFCKHVVASALPLVVEDARLHPLVRENPVIKELNVVAYLGIPLTTPKGTTLGSFCVIDSQPRKWNLTDQQTLAELAMSVMSEIALRFAHDEMRTANSNLLREGMKRETLLQALDRSSTRLRAAQRLAGVGSFVLHVTAAHHGHWSDEACRIFATTAAQAPVTVPDFAERLVHPEDRQRVATVIERTMNLQQSCQIEYRTSKVGGEVHTLLTAIEPEINANGDRAALLTVLDISKRIQAEAKLEAYRGELWHVARLATAGEMATVIAHELNQPLASIAHTAYACERLIANGRIERGEIVEHLASIAGQAKRASKIIGQIRSYVRKQPSAPRPLDFNQVVDDILDMLAPLSLKQGIEIKRIRARARLAMVGDEIQLGQLVLNLVRNAFDAVTANPASQRIVAVATRREISRARIVLEVADNGPGIAADGLDAIFEPFFSTRSHGLGMGLPIAKTIAEAHHAVLSAKRGKSGCRGACFQVVFPMVT